MARNRKPKPLWVYLMFLVSAGVYAFLDKFPEMRPFCIPAIFAVVIIGAGIAGIIHEAKKKRDDELLMNAASISALSPTEFERYVGLLFKKQNYHVKHIGGKGDRGVDLRIEKEKDRAVVQCKCYRVDRPIGPDIIRELHGTLARERAARAYLVTTSSFTPGAIQEAQAANIILIDGKRLAAKAKQLGMPGEL